MCGMNEAVCLHGECVVETVDGAAYEHCKCYAMYSGSQCSFRGELLYWELPVACALMLILLGVGVVMTTKTIEWLRFERDKHDTFAFPRRWEEIPGACLLRGKWTGPARKGLPTKPAKHHMVENIFIIVVVLGEIVPWVQVTAVVFLPVVPWPKASQRVAEILRLSLLYPLWSHLDPNQFPRLMLYLSLGFVPGVLLIACILGAKRFPLFKPQPKNAPAEDSCTLVLRLYSEWLTLPVMIGMLLPLECVVIGYYRKEGTGMTLPNLNGSCFTLWQSGMAAAGSIMLILFYVVSSAIVIQLNCEASPPEPTLWTHVRYTRLAHVLKAPLAMSVVASVNGNALLLSASCILTSLILGIMNAKLKPCVLSLINGLRLAGAIMALWSSVIALVASIVDDPGATIVYEAWSLGTIAISAISLSGLFLYHSEDFWHQLALTAKASATIGSTNGKVVEGAPKAKIAPTRRSSAAEKLRSRSKHELNTS